MYRFAIEFLKSWKEQSDRKPLVIRGARQVGKSSLARMFGPNSKPILPTTRQGYNRKCLIFLSEVLLSFTCKL